jgi:type II secretory pathway pseudopilin PulG
MKSTFFRHREGFALVVAMLAMVIVGALVAGALFVSTQQYRISRNTLHQERALAAAEAGMAQALQDWDPPTWGGDKLRTTGDTMSRTYSLPNGSRADVRITRLNSATFLVVSDGATSMTDRLLNARRRTGMLLRDKIPDIPGWGAFSSSGTTRLTGTASISGNDLPPPGWTSCDQGTTNRAAVANDNPADVSSSGTCSGFTCATGTTAVAQVAALADTNEVLTYGDMKYADFVASATKVFDAGLSLPTNGPTYNPDGSCKTSDPYNWGDPARASPIPGKCESYFPVIYFRGAGETTLNGVGSGQGVIVADGSLKLNGAFEFYGVIIVRGNISTLGNGNKIFGAALAANIGCTTIPCNNLSGASTIQFSSCAMVQSLRNKKVPVISSRAWSDLF